MKIVEIYPEEEMLISAYRKANSRRKRDFVIYAEVLLGRQAEDEEILLRIAEGRPLNEEQASAWNGWVKGYVESGEYRMPPRLRVVSGK